MIRASGALCLLAVCLAAPLAAQSGTGEFRLIGLGAYTPAVSGTTENPDQIGPPEASGMAGGTADISFRTGRLTLGPAGSVLRGPKRRVWTLGGVARYELAAGRVRPYGILGAEYAFWDRQYRFTLGDGSDGGLTWGSDANGLAGNLGGGLILGGSSSHLSAVAELRYHHSLTEDELNQGSRTAWTLGLGLRVAW